MLDLACFSVRFTKEVPGIGFPLPSEGGGVHIHSVYYYIIIIIFVKKIISVMAYI
jgi:hypothetical protein